MAFSVVAIIRIVPNGKDLSLVICHLKSAISEIAKLQITNLQLPICNYQFAIRLIYFAASSKTAGC
jgi:hypothetical protein